MFNSVEQEYISGIEYKCQLAGANKERPDIVGINSEGKELIICEAKFYAGLTANQPNAYLDRMLNNDGKALVFICPEARRVSLWSKVVDLCSKRNVKTVSEYCVTVDGIAMSIVTWREIIETLRRVATVSAVSVLSDIAQLDGLCEMMDRTSFIPFTEEDLGPEIAIREERYYQVIDALFDKLMANKEIKASAKGLKASPRRSGYSRYIKVNDMYLCLRYSRTAWINKDTCEHPFWFYFTDDRSNRWVQSNGLREKLGTIADKEKIMFSGTYEEHIGLALHPLLNVPIDDVVEDLMEQILSYIARLTE